MHVYIRAAAAATHVYARAAAAAAMHVYIRAAAAASAAIHVYIRTAAAATHVYTRAAAAAAIHVYIRAAAAAIHVYPRTARNTMEDRKRRPFGRRTSQEIRPIAYSIFERPRRLQT